MYYDLCIIFYVFISFCPYRSCVNIICSPSQNSLGHQDFQPPPALGSTDTRHRHREAPRHSWRHLGSQVRPRLMVLDPGD